MLFAGLALFASCAFASTFGDSIYAASAPINNCDDTKLLSLPVNVSVPSRINVSAQGTYNRQSTDLTLVRLYAYLLDGTDTTILAASQFGYVVATGSTDSPFVSTAGLLHSGQSNHDPTADIFMAAPGSYVLEMHALALNGACTGNPVLFDPTLTYILLSSAFDRIFADGFQAMLNTGGDVATVA